MSGPSRAARWIPQTLRGVLGLAFPWLITLIPADVRITGPVLAGGILLYATGRFASLFEPETLRRGGARASLGEGIFVCLTLIVALVALAEGGYLPIGIGTGVLIVVGYLLVHAIVLPIALAMRASKLAESPARPGLRRLVYTGAFVAEETAALACIGLAVHAHVEARQGPWTLWDVTPIFPLLLLFLYVPLLRLESAANPSLSEEESVQASLEGLVLQIGAILVAAFTGVTPWL